MLNKDIKDYYRNVEHYDWITDTRYPEKLFHALRTRHIVDLVHRFVHGTKILDLGCGTGLITRHLKGSIVGVDINPWAIERATIHCPGVSLKVADAENLPFGPDTFDAVVCTDMLEHLLDPTLAVAEVRRVLKHRGVLIGEVPSKSFIWKLRKYITTTCPVEEPFHHNYRIGEVYDILRAFDLLLLRRSVLGLEISFVARKEGPWL